MTNKESSVFVCDLLSKVLFILNYTFFLAKIFILNLVAIQNVSDIL
jgi:hypothetical protein